MRYPMFVVRVADFLRMTEARPHQLLRVQGLVADFHALRDAQAAFVTHQWCSSGHADPHFRQLAVLQEVLRRAIAGTLRFSTDIFTWLTWSESRSSVKRRQLRLAASWYVWYDFFSVPQPKFPAAGSSQHVDLGSDLGKAVASLHMYIDSCAVFLVLAPTVLHEDGHLLDYTTWKSRGWCRLERLARVASLRRKTPLLLVKRQDTLFEIGAHDFLHDPVGEGSFSDAEDRARLGATVRLLLEMKLRSLLADRRIHEFRRFLSCCPSLLRGLPVPEDGFAILRAASAADPDSFARLIRAASPVARLGGTTPLLLAASLGNVPLIRLLLQRRADIELAEACVDSAYSVKKGQRPLMAAAKHGHAAAVAFLADARADLSAGDFYGHNALSYAASVGTAETVRVLLQLRADVNARTRDGLRALDGAVSLCRPDIAALLLAQRASAESSDSDLTPVYHCAFMGGGGEMMQLLLDAGAPMDIPIRIPPRWTVRFRWHRVLYKLGSRRFFNLAAYHIVGATPLMAAVIASNRAGAEVLLAAGCDTEARNRGGATARDLVRIFDVDIEIDAPVRITPAGRRQTHAMAGSPREMEQSRAGGESASAPA